MARAADCVSSVTYGVSKTANIMFIDTLKRRLVSQGIETFAVHPGGELIIHPSLFGVVV